MGTSTLVQLNIANYSKMETATKPKNNVAVMEALTETGEITAKDLREINCCRIYLRVFYISHISTFNGQEITAWARKVR
jgi:hypothetical protein